jgi:hypothetical protein
MALLFCPVMVLQNINVRRKEAVWGKALFRGGVEECEGKLVALNYPYRFECDGLLVWRARVWANREGLGEVAGAAEGTSAALGGQLRVRFVVRGAKSEDGYGALGRRIKHGICL